MIRKTLVEEFPDSCKRIRYVALLTLLGKWLLVKKTWVLVGTFAEVDWALESREHYPGEFDSLDGCRAEIAMLRIAGDNVTG